MFDRPGRLLTGAASSVLLLWIVFTAGLKLQEMIIGVVSTGLTVAFFANLLRTEKLSIDLHARDLGQAWRLPGLILKDCWIVTVVLFRDLFGMERAGSYYRACGFRSSRRDPVLIGRSALATTYATTSPNMMVIGIDPKQSLMLFHQLQRDDVSDLARALGAQQ